MQRHTTTGVTAAGILPSSSGGGAGGGTGRSTTDPAGGQSPLPSARRSAGGLGTGSGGAGAGGSGAAGSPGHGTGSPAAAATSSGGAGLNTGASSVLGRMIGAPNTSMITVPVQSPRGPPGWSGMGGLGPGGAAQRSGQGSGAASGISSGTRGIGAAGAGVVPGLARPGGRSSPKDTGAAAARKVAAIDNIAEALGRFFQESMDLAPKPPPRPPSSSSSGDGDIGPISSDDEGVTQEEMDVLEKIYMVMPNLESPGRGAHQPPPRPPQSPSPPPSTNTGDAPRTSASTVTTATGSRPPSPLTQGVAAPAAGQHQRVPLLGAATGAAAGSAVTGGAAGGGGPGGPLTLQGAAAAAAGAAGAAAGPAGGGPPGPAAGSPMAKRRARLLSGKAGRSQPIFLPSKAVLSYHQKAMGANLPVRQSGSAATQGQGAGSTPGAIATTGNFAVGGNTVTAAGPYGSLSQMPEAPITSAYVNRDADFLMVQHMVSAALAAKQSRAAATAAAAASLAIRQPSSGAMAGGALSAAASPTGGAAGSSQRRGRAKPPPGAARRKGGADGKKTKAPPPPPVLLPLPAVPVHLQHLVRADTASVGALMGRHQPAGIDPAIIAAVVSGGKVDPVAGLPGSTPPQPRPLPPPSPPPRPGSPSRPRATAGRTGGPPGAGGGGERPESRTSVRSGSPTPGPRSSVALPAARPLSGSNVVAFGRTHLAAPSSRALGARPSTAPAGWAAARLERLRRVAATKAAACASMSPLRASLAGPTSGLKSSRTAKPLSETEFGVFNRTMDTALMPLTRAAAKLGTYGEAFPSANELFPPPMPPGAPAANAAAAAAAAAAAGGQPKAGPPRSASPATGRPAAAVAASALMPVSLGVAQPMEGTSAAVTGLPGEEDTGPRRKMRRQDVGAWEWPLGRGVAAPFDMLQATRHAVAAALADAEEDEAGHSGPCDRVGEVGRLMRRFRKQGGSATFNLSHAVNGIDQVVALVDVLGHADLAHVSELLLAGNSFTDDVFAPLGSRLCSPACGSLRQLDLGYNGLSAASAELLLPLMKDEMAAMSKAQRLRRGLDTRPPHGVLTRLVLDANPIGDAGAELLCEAAASDYTQLAELRLSRCGLGERGAAAAGRLLENSSAIKILDLSWNTLGRRGGQALGEGLRNASSIQQLLVGWTGITDQGASHIAKAIKSNASLMHLDMSGDSVSGDTSLVLLDSVAENGALRVLVLRDNPVGVLAARRLLKAAHQGVLETVDLLGCSFGGMGSSTVVWDPHDPDGVYELDLEVPAHYQVATELVGLAARMGLRSWRTASLNGQPFRLNSTSKRQLPLRGRLRVEFVSCTPVVREDGPLTDSEVRSMWFAIADPDGRCTPAGPMVLPAYDTQQPPAATPGAGPAAPGSPRRQASVAAKTAKPAGRGGGGAGRGGGGGGMPGAPGGGDPSSATELKGATDEWKLSLLEALVTDVYLTCGQLKQMVRCFEGRDARVEAVVQAFGVLTDTENFYAVLEELDPGSRAQVESRLGRVRLFFPENPTGRYTLMLSQLPHQCMAKLLLQMYRKQYDDKLTKHPEHVCFTTCIHDGVPTDVSDPHKLYLPQEGILELCFVDLRPPPPGSRALSRPQFALLLSALISAHQLDPVGLTRALDRPGLSTAVCALRRWAAWSGRHPLSAYVPHLWAELHALRPRPQEHVHDAEAAATGRGSGTGTGDGGGASGGRMGMGRTWEDGGRPRSSRGDAAAAEAARDIRSAGSMGGAGGLNLPRDGSRDGTSRSAGGVRIALSRIAVASSFSVRDGTAAAAAAGAMRGSSTNGDGSQGSAPETPSAAASRRAALSRRATSQTGFPDADGSVGGPSATDQSGAPPSPFGTGGSPLRDASPAKSRVGGGPGGGRAPPTATIPAVMPPVAAGVMPVYVRDMERYVETIRILSVRHYLTCWQLVQLLMLLPPGAIDEKVETVTAFWARTTDREAHWVDVMRSLSNEQQVRVGQRLGYMNVYNENRPAMHYRLRMFKEDEHQLAWQLYNKSLDSPIACWRNLTIDEVPKRVNQGVNMWTVLRGNAADGTTPQTTLEFDFVWPDDDAHANLAARQIQRAWRLHKNPKGGGMEAPQVTRASAAGVPRFAAFSRKKGNAPASKMNDPKNRKK